jgi:hypothetical protein
MIRRINMSLVLGRRGERPTSMINVYSKRTNQYLGVIKRKTTHERQFGNFGAFEVSVGGKRYWGSGRNLYLPDEAIHYLVRRGEIHFKTPESEEDKLFNLYSKKYGW